MRETDLRRTYASAASRVQWISPVTNAFVR